MANAEQERIDAIGRYLRGESASAICRLLGRTRDGLYKWLKRYDPADPTWARTRSRAPHRTAGKTRPDVEQLVAEIRSRLVATKYAQRGALAIQWQLQQLGVGPLPALWTINRILKRQGLVAKPPAYVPCGTAYPALEARHPHAVHQLDLVGPRYLEGGSRLYSIHVIDACSNAVALAAAASKRDTNIVEAVVGAWQRLGIPRCLQVDNELSFRGSNRYPRSFGLLIRLCLYLGVEIVVIPEAEPWRNGNGSVERFNGVYDKLFFRSQRFRNVEHLAAELARFETVHNTHHRYAKLGQRVPWEAHTATRHRLLPQRFAKHQGALPFRDGRVSFVQLTDAHGRARFFSESFLVDPSLVHAYVTGTIFTRRGLLKFTHQHRVLKVYKYAVTKRQV